MNIALPLLLALLCAVVSVVVYAVLLARISSRPPASHDPTARVFGLPEAVIATALILFLLLGALGSMTTVQRPQITGRVLVENLFFTLGIVVFVAGFLRIRGFDVGSIAGFSRPHFLRTIITGAALLVAAYPLIGVADAITQRVLGSGSSKQTIVELFNSTRSIDQRMVIIVFAVAIAPAAEEFLFRFFLYGVIKRYLGRFVGLVVNSLLFAAVHTHLPSFAPLFVLGSCFTIAYEWSGTILIPMTMHALFNAVSLTVLAFPDLLSQ